MFDKRGLSNIVATVLIVLLSLVAVSVVWIFLSPVFEESSLKARADSLCVDTEVKPMKCEYINSDGSFNLTSAVLKHNSGEVKKMKAVLIYEDGETKIAEASSSGQYSSIEFATNQLLGITHSKEPQSLEGWPVVQVSNGEFFTCTQSPVKIDCLRVSSGSSGGSTSPVCGNGQVETETGEACDDGNTNSGDGCNSTCGVEIGWTCMWEPSMCTTICGDDIIKGGEVCDGSNLNGQNCVSQDFPLGGVLTCSPDCMRFNTTLCNTCSIISSCSNYQSSELCQSNPCQSKLEDEICFWGALPGQNPVCNGCTGITCGNYTNYGQAICQANPCGVANGCTWTDSSSSCDQNLPV